MLKQIDFTQAQYELTREKALARLGGKGEIPPAMRLFRLPYGRCSDASLRLLAEKGLSVIQWNVVADENVTKDKDSYAKKLANEIKPGSILLLHANKVPKSSAYLARKIVENLQNRGFTFVTVGKLLEMGVPQRFQNGYFSVKGDNLALDAKFGKDGTGVK